MPAARAILIAGPTASGKSALALELAGRRDSLIINADAMQVYSELRIISARPGGADEARAPHALYGHVPAAQRYSVGLWLKDAAEQLQRADAEGRMPIFVGGTGLYFKALTEGLADIPAVPEQLVQDWQQEAEKSGTQMLHRLLSARDAETAARIKDSDTQRLVRALSVLDATGRGLAAWHQQETAPALLSLAECDAMFLKPDRAALYRRIDARFDQMMAEGALEEVARLRELELDPSLPAMRAHGVPHLIAHLDGRIALEAAVRRAKGDTRRYAKRQTTWFRHQMPGWRMIDVPLAGKVPV